MGHFESYLNRCYPSWKRGSPRYHSTDNELSTSDRNPALPVSQCFSSPHITRKSCLNVPDSQLLEYSKYKFSSETNIASPSIISRLYSSSPRNRKYSDSGTVFSRAQSYPDFFRVFDNTTDAIDVTIYGQNTTKHLSQDDLSQSLDDANEHEYFTKYNKTISSDISSDYKHSSVYDEKDTNLTSTTVVPRTFYKPFPRSRSLHVTPSKYYSSSRTISTLPTERRSVLTRSSVVYQKNVSVQSDDSFISPNVSRVTSSQVSRILPPRLNRSKTKQNPLQVVDDIFQKYLINYDKRYLCDPTSESKYGKYLYPSKCNKDYLDESYIHSPNYTSKIPSPHSNFFYLKGQTHPPYMTSTGSNKFELFSSNESLYERNFTYNHHKNTDDNCSRFDDWKDLSFYHDRYKYNTETNFNNYQNNNNTDDYSSRYKPFTENDKKGSASRTLLHSKASRLAEPSRSLSQQRLQLSNSSLLEQPILTTNNQDELKYTQLGQKASTYESSLMPSTTPKKVSFSKENLDYAKTGNDKSQRTTEDFRELRLDEMTPDKRESDVVSYKPYEFQVAYPSDYNLKNTGEKINTDKYQSPEEKETYKHSPKGLDNRDSYDDSLHGGENNEWKVSSQHSAEDLTANKSDFSKKFCDLDEAEEATVNIETNITKPYQNKKEVDDASLNIIENPEAINLPSDTLKENNTINVSLTYDINEDDKLSPGIKVNDLKEQVDSENVFEKEIKMTASQQDNHNGGHGLSLHSLLPKEQMNDERKEQMNDEIKEQMGPLEYIGDESEANDEKYSNKNTEEQDEFNDQQLSTNYSSKEPINIQKQNTEQYYKSKESNEQPFNEYQQQADDVYEQPLHENQYGQGDILEEYPQTEGYSTHYGQELNTEYQQSEYDQPSTEDGQVHYENETFPQSSEQEKSSVAFQDNQFVQQTQAESIRVDTNRYSNDDEPEGPDVRAYGQQNVTEQHLGHDYNIQDQQQIGHELSPTGQEYPQSHYERDYDGDFVHKQPDNFKENYKVQDSQVGYDQGLNDTQQIAEQYQGDEYVQDQYGPNYNRGSQEFLPDQYQNQPTVQEYPEPHYEEEYKGEFTQKQQYQEEYKDNQSQNQQYLDDYSTSYQNDPQFQYPQENTTEQENYRYEQPGEQQYQEPYDGQEDYRNTYNSYNYDNPDRGQADDERQQHYTQDQVYDENAQQPYQQQPNADSQPYDSQNMAGYQDQSQLYTHDQNTLQPYQQPAENVDSQPYDSQQMEGYVDQPQIVSTQAQGFDGYNETTQFSEMESAALSELASPPPAADLSRVLESDLEPGPGLEPTKVTNEDTSDLDFSSAPQ